jgi:hypothetical protein
MRYAGWTALCSFALLAAAGCSSHERPAWVSLDPADWAHRSISDAPVMIDVAGPVAVDVQSFNGDVTLLASDEYAHGEVMIKRVGVHGGKRQEEAKLSLEQIEYSAALEQDPTGPVLRVRTWTGHAEPHFQRAHVTIHLPAVHGVSIHTTRGNVTAVDVQGPVDVSTTEGDVRVMSNWALTEDVRIVNREGDIDYRVRGESTGDFDLETVNGRVMQKAVYGRMFVRPMGKEKLRAILNGGENPIVLRTTEGDIRVAVVHDPTDVGAVIFDP